MRPKRPPQARPRPHVRQSLKFGSKTCTTYVSWSATQITCNVPTNAKYGKVSVTVATFAGKSNAKNFTVKR